MQVRSKRALSLTCFRILPQDLKNAYIQSLKVIYLATQILILTSNLGHVCRKFIHLASETLMNLGHVYRKFTHLASEILILTSNLGQVCGKVMYFACHILRLGIGFDVILERHKSDVYVKHSTALIYN